MSIPAIFWGPLGICNTPQNHLTFNYLTTP